MKEKWTWLICPAYAVYRHVLILECSITYLAIDEMDSVWGKNTAVEIVKAMYKPEKNL